MNRLASCALWLGMAAFSAGQTDKLTPFQQARALEEKGRLEEAFLKYLSIPGCEYAAVRLARPKARAFLEVLAAARSAPVAGRSSLVARN